VAGRIGRAVASELRARRIPFRGFDRAACTAIPELEVGELLDRGAVRRAMTGVHTLIHLAATPDDVADPVKDLFPTNIVGVYEVLEAAAEAGVCRLILASSGQVVWHQRTAGPWPITAEAPPTPRGWYACTKVFLEAAGRAFAEHHAAHVLAVRLGWCPRTVEQVREIQASEWAQDVYLSPGDAGRFFACAVASPSDYRFEIVYATSRPLRPGKYDLHRSRELLGFEPQDAWPRGAEEDLNTAG